MQQLVLSFQRERGSWFATSDPPAFVFASFCGTNAIKWFDAQSDVDHPYIAAEGWSRLDVAKFIGPSDHSHSAAT